MSESSLASIQTWLTAPMKQDVSEDADAELRARLLKRWKEYGKPFQHQRIAHFARDMRKGEVIELRDAEHGDFLQTGPVQTRTVREMRRFLFSSP